MHPASNGAPIAANAINLVQHWCLAECRRLALPNLHCIFDSAQAYHAEQIGGGITNILFRVRFSALECSRLPCLDQDSKLGSFVSHGVSVRFYGPSLPELIDRGKEAQILDFLSSRGLCKRVFYRFEGGQIDEWREGRSIQVAEMADAAISCGIAQQMARLHSEDYSSLNFASKPSGEPSQTWSQIWNWMHWLERASASGCPHVVLTPRELQSLSQLAKRLRRHNASLKSPMVICHNDLLSGNIVLVPDAEGTLREREGVCVDLIDYEYAGIGERAFDIANHFCEFAGLECDYDLLPSDDFCLSFLDAYLQRVREFAEQGDSTTTTDRSGDSSADEGDSSTDSSSRPVTNSTLRQGNLLRETEQQTSKSLLAEVKAFFATTHLYWTLWAMVQHAHYSSTKVTPPYDYEDYAKHRLRQLLRPETLSALTDFECAC